MQTVYDRQVGEAVLVDVGDTVYARYNLSEYNVLGTRRLHAEIGDELLVTRTGFERILVRKDGVSAWLSANYVYADSGSHPPQRKLGTPPEGDHIAVNDPRIQWLFDDMAAFADRKQWCPQYDDLAKQLGIPGRPKDYTARYELYGTPAFTVTTTIRARSQEEADATLRERILSIPPTEVQE